MPREFCCPECGARSLLAELSDEQPIVCDRCGHATQSSTRLGGTLSAARKGRSKKWFVGLGIAGGIALAYALFSSAYHWAHEVANWTTCNSHFKQIGVALHNYASDYGCFPPAYVADANGQPMHSWRVLILPYLVEEQIYSQYDLSEPWDSPKNQQFASRMPDVYRCPAVTNFTPGFTSYLASVGPGRLFDGPRANKVDDVTDGLSNTIAMIESNVQVPWLDPLDGASPGSRILPTVPSRTHPPRTNVLLADGSTMLLDGSVSSKTIAAMQTINGGEPVAHP